MPLNPKLESNRAWQDFTVQFYSRARPFPHCTRRTLQWIADKSPAGIIGPLRLSASFHDRSRVGRPTRAFFFCVEEIKGARHHYVRVELVPDELESSLEYPLLLAVVEFHLRNNIPRIPFVEIHSPLSEPVHYVKVSQQRIVSRLGNEWRNARHP